MESEALARSPSFATFPLSVTRPASIHVSISRREPRPAAASSFCSRSPEGAASRLAVGAGGGMLLGFFFFSDGGLGSGNHFQLEGLGDFL